MAKSTTNHASEEVLARHFGEGRNPQTLITDHIDIWTSAIKAKSASGRGSSKKIDLYGIKKLRELILELAVRGKLVPQDPNDEPASDLLKQINNEQIQLVKDKKIKKTKVLVKIEPFDFPFALPVGWEFSRLNDWGEWGAGSTPSRSNSEYYGGNIHWFKPGELNAEYNSESEEYITELAVRKSSVRYNKIGDVVVVMYGATIGKYSILAAEATTNQAVCACTPFSKIYNRYLLLVLNGCKSRLVGIGAGGAQPNISRDKLITTIAPVPPIKEQHRIVTKVDELMTLCDQLVAQTEASIKAHKTLVETLLATLTNAKDAIELNDSWQRISQHFEVLFTTQDSIDQLKQTILQLAVMGKLVKQDPNDEPASILSKRITAEKEQLIKDKKIKKQKPLPSISIDEKSIELSNGGEWVRLGEIYKFLNGYAFKSEWFQKQGVKLLRNINVGHSQTKWTEKAHISEEIAKEFDRYQLEAGDIVISLDHPIISNGLKYAVIESRDLPCLLLQRVAKFKSYGNVVLSNFLSRWLESDLFLSSINLGRTNGVPHISTKQLEMMAFPLFSLNKRRKIVMKVNELVAICDSLTTNLNEAQNTQLQITDVIVEKAL
jgi:type I restriction enzyme S subunit